MKSLLIMRHSIIVGVVLALVLLFSAPACCQNVAAKQTRFAQTIENLKSDLDSIFSEIATPGAAIAIVSADSVVWIGTYGFANLKTKEPVTEETQFCTGSCTKSFVGLGFLTLLDEHKVDLNTAVRDIAPEIEIDNPWADTDPVRIVHLLEHTAGFDDSHPNWFYFKRPVLSLRRALNEKANLRRVRWPPGTRFSYSSAGYTLAGYVLEKATGQRYSDYLKQEVLNPIGMTASTIGSSEECRRRLAVGYDRFDRPFPVWYDYDEPAGAMNSSIREMALFVKFLLNRGAAGDSQIISHEQFSRIGNPTTTLASEAGVRSGYSFGIGTSFRHGSKWLTHGGAVPGFLSEYGVNLDNGIGYVVLQNSFDVSFYDDMFTCVRNYMTSLADSLTPPPESQVSLSVLESYCGYYEPRSPRQQLLAFSEILAGGITISFGHDTLYTQGFIDDRAPLLAVSNTLFRRPWQPEATSAFVQPSDGDMAYVSNSSFYESSQIWRTYLYRVLVFGAIAVMISSVLYALFWVPLHVYKKIKHLENRSKYLTMRIVPLLAVLSLILGTLKMGDQTILEFGMKTLLNEIFFISTLLFAVFSTLSLFTTYRSYHKPVKTIARLYASLLSLSCFGITLYLGYWGLIGLRLWAY